MYTEFTKKKVFELLTIGAGSPASCRHGRQKVSIPEGDLTGRRVMVDAPQACLLGRTRGSTLFVCHDGAVPEVLLLT